MNAADGTEIPVRDMDCLRRLAERKLEISATPANSERRQAWYDHDAGEHSRPMVLAETGGLRDKARPVTDADLFCTSPWGRAVERSLRVEIYQFDVLQDDHVVEPRMCTGWKVAASDYGVQVVQHHAEFDGALGARRWDSPIQDLDADLHRLQQRTFTVDREATHAEVARLEHVFGQLMPVEIRGGHWWTLGMTWTAIELIGLENLMLAMYDQPDGLHGLMAFLRDDALAFADWLQTEGLLCRNDENDYIGSGSMGYTRTLARPGADAVHTCDQWVLLESQETVGVSPMQFAEFIFPYQRDLAARFGKVYYGCCEPVHGRIDVLTQMPNLARVSVSPWADEARMAAVLGDRIIYSRKPNPTAVSTEVFDEAAILADLRQTLSIAGNCRLELIMKDVHTLCEHPERLPRWVELARQAIEEAKTR
mgnify:CR=1 FL=1